MPITNTNVTVTCQGNGTGASPVLLANPGGSLTDPVPVSIHNPGVPTLWTGGPTVTPSNGIPIVGGATGNASLMNGDPLYGIFATVTTTVNVMKGRQ